MRERGVHFKNIQEKDKQKRCWQAAYWTACFMLLYNLVFTPENGQNYYAGQKLHRI